MNEDRGLWPLNEHGGPHLQNEIDLHIGSQNHEESGYGLDLDVLTVSY